MLTIRDVARLADVSVATVSAVINGKSGVSDKLVQRVQRAMEALDYHPNHVARSLKVRQTNTIGMMIPDVTNPFFADVMHGVEGEARRNNYSVIFCNADEDPELERRQLSMLFSRRVDGVLLAPTDSRVAQDRLINRRFPLVFFDRIPTDFAGTAVVTDNFEASRQAARHLIGLGHRRIAIITGRLNLSNGLQRLEGFRRGLQEANLPFPEAYLRCGEFQLETAHECGLDLMRLAEPPTAVFCCNNKMTLGLMRALGDLRIPCPERVSVLGFDDFDWAVNFSPRLTTVAQPSYQVGKKAVELLLNKLRVEKGSEGTDHDMIVTLKCELRVRDSTAPPYPAAREKRDSRKVSTVKRSSR
ncbi:MAG TPA: LacI family DNA-binding transcriptional regulator [Terriglobia bacterium]|nr:LacI family DNA-binding transcriptional regulator [Terriglobia bacterium]